MSHAIGVTCIVHSLAGISAHVVRATRVLVRFVARFDTTLAGLAATGAAR